MKQQTAETETFTSNNLNYEPIRDELSSSIDNRHNVSYIPLDDINLNYHLLQCLQNGLTAIVCLNETDVLQSNYLLNLKLEADNCTLIWSKPAWDLVNLLNTNNINTNSNTLNNSNQSGSNTLLGVNKNSNIRSSFVQSLESSAASITGKSESYFRKRLATTSSPPSKFRSSHAVDLKYATIATSGLYGLNEGMLRDEQNIKYSINSLIKHYVQHDYVNIDSFEGYLDLNLVKHIRLGCIDAQIFSSLQLIAKKYSIVNFDQTNIISIVYGNVFSENR